MRMVEANLEYLKKSLDFLGFGTRLNEVLEAAVRRELPKFSLGITQHYTPAGYRGSPAMERDHLRFELNFSKSTDSDMVFLNNYQAVLTRPDHSAPIKQVFDLEKDHRMTALQAYRLLCGFSFEKEIQLKAEEVHAQEPVAKRLVWLKLNLAVTDAYGNHPLHRFYPEYNFDLEKSVEKYPFYLAGEDRKEKLLKTLRAGGLAEVELMVEGKPSGVYVAAEPQFKTLNIFNRELVRIPDAEIFGHGQNSPENALDERSQQSSAGQANAAVPWKQEGDTPQGPKVGR